MNFQEIKSLIVEAFGEEAIAQSHDLLPQPALTIAPEYLVRVCHFLHTDARLYFDFMACLTGLDNSPAQDTLEVVYHLESLVYEHRIVLRVFTARAAPTVPSLSHIWRTADWHEREAFDLLGIQFEGHPDLRRILLPQDWEGHPLRKDYEAQNTYHGIQVKY